MASPRRRRRTVPAVPPRSRPCCLVLRTSRFFPEADDHKVVAGDLRRRQCEGERVPPSARRSRRRRERASAGRRRAPAIGFGRYIISATTPFLPEDLLDLRVNAPGVVRRRVPAMRPSTRVAAGRCFRASIGCMSTIAPAASWGGGRAMTSPHHRQRLTSGGRLPRARWRGSIGAKGYHAERLPTGLTRSNEGNRAVRMALFTVTVRSRSRPRSVSRRRHALVCSFGGLEAGMSIRAFSRRGFLRTTVATTAITTFGPPGRPYLSLAADRPAITHGLQSGDASIKSGVIWARADRPARLTFEIATSDKFNNLVRAVESRRAPGNRLCREGAD